MRSLPINTKFGFPIVLTMHSVQQPGGWERRAAVKENLFSSCSSSSRSGIGVLWLELMTQTTLRQGPNMVPLKELKDLLKITEIDKL